MQTDGKSVAAALGIKLAVLALALILTGIGAALSLNMRIVPNPAMESYRRFRISSTRVLDSRRIAWISRASLLPWLFACCAAGRYMALVSERLLLWSQSAES